VLVAVVDLEVTDLEGGDFHDLVERLVLDWRAVDQEVTVLDPGLVVVTRRGVRLDGDADAPGELDVQVEIRVSRC
jgi:hypothetical protein